MSRGSNYMELPTDLKLKILCHLDNKDVRQCRMVCKRFVPRDIGIALEEYQQKYYIGTRLSLSPKVDPFTSVDWDILMELFGLWSPLKQDIDKRYFYLESGKDVQNLQEVPVSLLENINWVLLIDSEDKPPLLTNLDIENCKRIKLCFIALLSNCPQVSQKLAKMFSSSQKELTHLAFGTTEMDLNCASLHDCTRLEFLYLQSDISVSNLHQLPTSLKTLKLYVPMGMDIPQLQWISENLLELQELYLVVNERNGKFSVEMFKNFCDLPSLTRMWLIFPLTHEFDTEEPDTGTLLARLEDMSDLCHCEGVEGVNAVHNENPDPRPNRDPLDILIQFEVTIQRQTFKGF